MCCVLLLSACTSQSAVLQQCKISSITPTGKLEATVNVYKCTLQVQFVFTGKTIYRVPHDSLQNFVGQYNHNSAR